MHSNHSANSTLIIQLTEPIVALRSTPPRTARQQSDGTDSLVSAQEAAPAVVRGLLTLQLAQPTRVSSIELSLQAKASTRYTQGTGTGRVDMTEQYNVHSTSTVVFKAWPIPQISSLQRAASTSTLTRQLLDDPTASEAQDGGDGGLPSGPVRSVSLDPQLLGVRRDPIPSDPVPPYTNLADRLSSLNAVSYPLVVGRPLSVASSSRITESSSSPILPQSSPTWDIRNRSSSRARSVRDFILARGSSMVGVPEDDGDDSDSGLCPDEVTYYGMSRIAASSSSRSPEQGRRGRSDSRLAFGKMVQMLDVVKDRLRSRSPRSPSRPGSDEQEERGRSLFKGKGKIQVSTRNVNSIPESDTDSLATNGANDDSDTDGWVVFPEGTYIYPIFFTIPHSSPPTIKADHGSLIWKVKSEVKQPSAFGWKMTAQKEITVVSVPKDDDSEEVDGVDLQWQWDNQFQYHVQIAGHGFPVGGEVPVLLTIMPLAKIKIHGIMVYLDERTEYYTRGESQARSDTIRRATLLVVKHSSPDERYSEPILPLTSDERDAFRKSPLHCFMKPGDDESEMVSSFMGPGPWTIRHTLRIPDSCLMLHPSNRAKGSNVMVNHTLKIVLRVEKEDKTGMADGKKLFDVVIHTPIQILSCRCTSAWSSLPRYEEVLGSDYQMAEQGGTAMCPYCTQHPASQRRSHAMGFLLASNGNVTTPSTPCSKLAGASSDVLPPDSLANCTRLHEQLMSGSVSESGEAPPLYECVGGCV